MERKYPTKKAAIPAARKISCEIQSARGPATRGETPNQEDAFATAEWLRRADADGSSA
jgi:hypothetical protein